MKKIIPTLLVPIYLLTVQTATASESSDSKDWNRDDVVAYVDVLDKKREEQSKKLEESSKKILKSRDGIQSVDSIEEIPQKELNSTLQSHTSEERKSIDVEKKIVQADGMTIEIKPKEEKKTKPSISIEVIDKNVTDAPAIIIEVKEKSELPPQSKISMELVHAEKVEKIKKFVEKKSLYPSQLIKVKNDLE